jgi:hypothetical protein
VVVMDQSTANYGMSNEAFALASVVIDFLCSLPTDSSLLNMNVDSTATMDKSLSGMDDGHTIIVVLEVIFGIGRMYCENYKTERKAR